MSYLPVLAPRPALAAVSLDGEEFRTVSDLIVFISNLPAEDRYAAQLEAANQLQDRFEERGAQCEDFWQYVQTSEEWKNHIPPQVFEQQWEPFARAADSARQTRERVDEAQQAVIAIWGQETFDTYLSDIRSYNAISNVRMVARRQPDFQVALRTLNRAIVDRLSHPGRGRRTTTLPTASDYARVTAGEFPSIPLCENELLAVGCSLDRTGVLVSVKEAEPINGRTLTIKDISTPASAPALGPIPEAIETGYEIDIPTQSTSPLSSVPEDLAQEAPDQLEISMPSMDIDSANEGTASEFSADLLGEGEEDEDAEEDSDYQAEPATKKIKRSPGQTGCDCGLAVPKGFKSRLTGRKGTRLPRAVALLREFKDFMDNKIAVCYKHQQNLASKLGLQTKHLNHDTLRERLTELAQAPDLIGDVRAAKETYRWFRKADRPTRLSDSLGPYRFFHNSIEFSTYGINFGQLIDELCGPGVSRRWQRDGSVILPRVFSWWWDFGLGPLINEEFDMYWHHQRRIGGKSNLGWLRTMVHSVVQQLMRQDPMYYLLYVCFRPDHRHWLVTYPYYTKFAKVDDSTRFRHIDVNIERLLREGRGANMIQGSVSVDDERADNCTELLLGMHRHLGEWYDRVVQRAAAKGEAAPGGLVQRIGPTAYTTADERKFNTRWESQPCPRGGVRISLPHLPHGAKGPSTRVRRTMLPWFVGIQSDHQQLEIVDGGTYADLRAAHLDLTAPIATPSGLANMYGAIPYRFPAAVSLSGLGSISDALVCRERWDSPTVIQELHELFGTCEQRDAFIQRWRKNAQSRVQHAFSRVKQYEVEAFGAKSYFQQQQLPQNQRLPDDQCDSDPDEGLGDDEE